MLKDSLFEVVYVVTLVVNKAKNVNCPCFFALGYYMVYPSVNSAATFIIGTLINVHSVPAFPHP